MIGIRIQKTEGGVPFENRYFTNKTDLDAAQALAGQIVLFEKAIHSVRVEFVKASLWVLGVSPRQFRPVPLSGSGVIAGANPTALELTVQLDFGTDNSYPYGKYYRVAVDASNTTTRDWGTPYLGTILTAMEEADGTGLWGALTTKTGAPLADPVLRSKVAFRQLDKRWYNRQPASP